MSSRIPPNPKSEVDAAVRDEATVIQAVVKAMFYHFNKHKMSAAECVGALGAAYAMVLHQQKNDADKMVLTKVFDEMMVKVKPAPGPEGN